MRYANTCLVVPRGNSRCAECDWAAASQQADGLPQSLCNGGSGPCCVIVCMCACCPYTNPVCVSMCVCNTTCRDNETAFCLSSTSASLVGSHSSGDTLAHARVITKRLTGPNSSCCVHCCRDMARACANLTGFMRPTPQWQPFYDKIADMRTANEISIGLVV